MRKRTLANLSALSDEQIESIRAVLSGQSMRPVAAVGQGQSEVIHKHAPKARDMTNRRCRYQGEVDEVGKWKKRNESSVRARVEHPFLILKKVFGFSKVRYRGIAKNSERLHVACALVNLFQLRRPLLAAARP